MTAIKKAQEEPGIAEHRLILLGDSKGDERAKPLSSD